MATQNAALIRFNNGLIGKRALARTDLDRTALSAEVMTNFVAHSLGDMMFRPGTAYISPTNQDLKAFHIPFIKAVDDTAILEITSDGLHVRVDDQKLVRPAVSTTFINGGFDGSLSGWEDLDEGGATSEWVTGNYLGLTGTRYNAAIRKQQVTVLQPNIEHAVRIIITQGNVTVRIGGVGGVDDYYPDMVLGVGRHSLSLVPTGHFFVQLSNREQRLAVVDSVAIEAAGNLHIPTPWAEADLPSLRYDQSGDVIFIACAGYPTYKIERRAVRSWSVVEYLTDDGPFRLPNITGTRIAPTGLNGNISLTASNAIFQRGHIGSLFRITSQGQLTSNVLTGDSQYGDSIRVNGVGASRAFTVTITGTWVGTVTLQRSLGAEGAWVDTGTVYTGNVTAAVVGDGLDNQIAYYRLGFNAVGHTSGTATVSLSYSLGGQTGIARVVAYISPTAVFAEVLKRMGGTAASEIWSEGAWSPLRGYPSALAFFDGRLWLAGKDNIWGSVSDAFYSFDDTLEGDSAPIIRSLGAGATDTPQWLAALQRLLVGTQGDEREVRSTSLDEPLTPTNFNIKSQSTQGSANVAAVKVDGRGLFVQRGGTRLMQLQFGSDVYGGYASSDLSLICPEVGDSGFTCIVVQRQPDTRIHCLRGDGKVAVLLFNPDENLRCWLMFETDGVVEDAIAMPGDIGSNEDKVYYCIKRTIRNPDNGEYEEKRYFERFALESECLGGTVNKLMDSHVVYSGVPTARITGLSHLTLKEVVVWGNGKSLGRHPVDGSGGIDLPEETGYAIIGLLYDGLWKSTKLAYASQLGTALTQRKKVSRLALILAYTHAQGLKYGRDFDNMDDMPLMERGARVDQDSIWEDYDADSFEFGGIWDTDSRICLKAQSPYPATVLAAVVSLETKERV